MQITWNTDVNAPCCPGEIDAEDGRSILIQTDWDYPGVAGSFGWSIRDVQRCAGCGSSAPVNSTESSAFACPECNDRVQRCCEHDGTDGTVDCPDCGVTAGEFISAAREWLECSDGVTVDDPGYFL